MVFVKRFYKIPHFWIILLIMFCGAIIYYFDRIPWLQDTFSGVSFQFARYSTYRILSVIPVAYAAYIFRWRGGVVAALLIASLLMPLNIQGVVYALVFGVIMGAALGLVRILNNVIWAKYYGRRHLGSISGAASLFMIVGTALGPLPTTSVASSSNPSSTAMAAS